MNCNKDIGQKGEKVVGNETRSLGCSKCVELFISHLVIEGESLDTNIL